MGILEDILAQLVIIAGNAGTGSGGGTTPPSTKDKDKAGAVKLEDVQDVIRELVAADADNKPKIKAAIKAIDKTAERAGDFESAPAKLAKLFTALNALKADDGDAAADDDDML